MARSFQDILRGYVADNRVSINPRQTAAGFQRIGGIGGALNFGILSATADIADRNDRELDLLREATALDRQDRLDELNKKNVNSQISLRDAQTTDIGTDNTREDKELTEILRRNKEQEAEALRLFNEKVRQGKSQEQAQKEARAEAASARKAQDAANATRLSITKQTQIDNAAANRQRLSIAQINAKNNSAQIANQGKKIDAQGKIFERKVGILDNIDATFANINENTSSINEAEENISSFSKQIDNVLANTTKLIAGGEDPQNIRDGISTLKDNIEIEKERLKGLEIEGNDVTTQLKQLDIRLKAIDSLRF